MTYREPFDSDPAARALLDDALLLRENPDGEKFTRYVFALHLRDRPLEQVRVNWTYQRLDDGGYEAVLTAERPIRVATLRVGPFPLQTRAVRVEGSAEPAVLRRGGSRLFADVALNVETGNVTIRVSDIVQPHRDHREPTVEALLYGLADKQAKEIKS